MLGSMISLVSDEDVIREGELLRDRSMLRDIFTLALPAGSIFAFLHRVMCLQLISNLHVAPEYVEHMHTEHSRSREEALMSAQIRSVGFFLTPRRDER